MKSAYPSSQSFFDATSDSIRAEDVDKCRSNSSFSSLADLFTNPHQSDLFPKNVRAPVFVPDEVRFPAKKKRECEERTSIWHEWGSGECQTENVAQESSGFSTDLCRLPGSKYPGVSSSSFPNLGSANISVVTEEFTFPARKNREEGSSWREERTSWQDWSTSGSDKDVPQTGSVTVVGPIKESCCSKSFDLSSSSKSSSFSTMASPSKGISDEVSFPARKKREERSFWQESSLDGAPSNGVEFPTTRESTSGVSSLADMYWRNPGSKCSSLFSEGTVCNTEAVIFPERKNHAGRNAWRDWANTGYSDWEDDDEGQNMFMDNSISTDATTSEEVTCPRVVSLPYVAPSIVGDWSGGVEEFIVRDFSPFAATARGMPSEDVSGFVGNVDESRSSSSSPDAELSRVSPASHSDMERTVDAGEFSHSSEEYSSEVHDVQKPGFRNLRNEQRSFAKTGKYPPPLGSLSRHGSSQLPHHMPWVQLQPIRSEGRFVLQEVKVTQPVVFQPIRKEGRLLLQLIGQDGSVHMGETSTKFHEDRPVAEVTVVAKEMSMSESLTMEAIELQEEAENTEFGLVDVVCTETVKRRDSSKVCPVFPKPPKLDADDSIIAEPEVSTAVQTTPVNSLKMCTRTGETVSSCDRRGDELEKTCVLEGGFFHDKPPPWLLSKSGAEDRRFDAISWLHSDVGFREKFSLSSSDVQERLGPNGNIITFQRESGHLRVQFQSLSRTCSLRHGLSGLNYTHVADKASSRRSRSRNSSVCDSSSVDVNAEEITSNSCRGRAPVKPALSICQGIIWDSFLSLTTAPLLRSLRTRPDLPGEPDLRLSNYRPVVTAALSCADGMGKQHHEKNFWEQQPCVS